MSNQSTDVDGILFPTELTLTTPKQSLTLIGGGTRSKWGFKVYAVGVYGESKLIKTIKKKSSPKDLNVDFSESKLAKTLLLKFRRGVASSDISQALGEALVNKIGQEKSSEFSTFILDTMGSDRLEKGSEISITCKGEKLWASSSSAEGNDTGGSSSIDMKGLCSAIFMVYLGDNPVSQQAKEGFEKGFADLVIG